MGKRELPEMRDAPAWRRGVGGARRRTGAPVRSCRGRSGAELARGDLVLGDASAREGLENGPVTPDSPRVEYAEEHRNAIRCKQCKQGAGPLIRVCSWCKRDGQPCLIGEKPPYDETRVTHGACARHALLLLPP